MLLAVLAVIGAAAIALAAYWAGRRSSAHQDARELETVRYELARRLGERLAAAGAVLVTGGLGGVMEAASQGAWSAGGRTVGVLPGDDGAQANVWVELPIPTGMGEGRNVLVVRTAEALVAVGGEWGTLSEIALARKTGRPVGLLGPAFPALDLPRFQGPAEAADWATAAARAFREALSAGSAVMPRGTRGEDFPGRGR